MKFQRTWKSRGSYAFFRKVREQFETVEFDLFLNRKKNKNKLWLLRFANASRKVDRIMQFYQRNLIPFCPHSGSNISRNYFLFRKAGNI